MRGREEASARPCWQASQGTIGSWAWVRADSSGGSARGQRSVTSTVNNNRREPFFLGVLVGGRYRLPKNPRTFLLDLRSPPFPRYPRRVSIRTVNALVVPFEKPSSLPALQLRQPQPGPLHNILPPPTPLPLHRPPPCLSLALLHRCTASLTCIPPVVRPVRFCATLQRRPSNHHHRTSTSSKTLSPNSHSA